MQYETRQTRGELYGVAIGLGLVGALLILVSLGKGGEEEGDELVNGGRMSAPHSSLDDSPTVNISISSWASGAVGQVVKASLPWAEYDGPGQNTYTYLRVVQNGVTVMGSGVAGIWVGPSNERTGCGSPPCPTADKKYPLVAPNQPQPNPNQSCPKWGQANAGSWLEAWMYPGPFCIEAGTRVIPTPVCGSGPKVGSADVYLEVYQKKYNNDADGFSSPVCQQRKWCRRTIYRNKVNFVA